MQIRPVLYGLAATLLAGALITGPAHAQRKSIDELVVANVNGEEISRGQLVARLLDYGGDEALDKMINRTLVFQAAKRLNLTVKDDEVAARMTELRNHFKQDADYRAFLTRSHLTEDQLREETRNTVLIQKAALAGAPLSDDELQQYDVRLLVAADKDTAAKWIKELDNGGNFLQLASERNQDPSLRRVAGRLRPFLRVEMIDVADAVEKQSLKPGDYTKAPVQLNDKTWAIIRMEGRVPFKDVSELEKDRLRTAVTAYRVDQWLQQTRAKAQVQKKSITDDPVAIVNGEPIPRAQLVSRLMSYQGGDQLEQIINRALLLQSAKKLGVSVPDAEADKKVADFKAQFPDTAAYTAFLGRNSLTEKQLRDQLKYTALMEKVALKDMPVKDDDLNTYDVRMLVAPDRPTAEKWVKDLDDGSDFAKLVQERSVDPNGREAEGRMKPFLKVEMLDIWRAIDEQHVKPGGYTRKPVLLTDGSWVLLKLENVNKASAATSDDREQYRKTVTRYRIQSWLTQARASAKIAYPVPLAAVATDNR